MTKQESIAIFTDLAENLEAIANAIDENLDDENHGCRLRHHAARIRNRVAQYNETQDASVFETLARVLYPVDVAVSRVCNDERLICNDYHLLLVALGSASADLKILANIQRAEN